VESFEAGPRWAFTWKRGDVHWGRLSAQRESLRDTFELSDDVYVSSGVYNFYTINLTYETPRGKLLRTQTRINAGSFYDGTRISLSTTPNWAVSRYFELSGFYHYNQVNFDTRIQKFIAHIARLKLLFSLNTKLEASTFIQYNSESRNSLINFRIRYNPKDGNDFYLVYNEGTDFSRQLYEFISPLTTLRAILAKYIHTFKF